MRGQFIQDKQQISTRLAVHFPYARAPHGRNEDRFFQFVMVMFLMLFVVESLAQVIGVLVKVTNYRAESS